MESSSEPAPWVRTAEEREERELHARRIVGGHLSCVRYFAIDYRRTSEVDEIQHGARLVVDAEEWERPQWRANGFHALDYGLELQLEDGRVFSSIWEMGGPGEGITFREESLRPERLLPDGVFAIWEVIAEPEWRGLVGAAVGDARLCWEDAGHGGWLLCSAVELDVGGSLVVLTLGKAGDGGDFDPFTCDDVAVVFGEDSARRLRVGRHRPGAIWRGSGRGS